MPSINKKPGKKKVSSKTYKTNSVPGSGKSATPAEKQGVTWRAARASSAERASARKEKTVRGATEGPKNSVPRLPLQAMSTDHRRIIEGLGWGTPRSTARSQSAAARKRRVR